MARSPLQPYITSTLKRGKRPPRFISPKGLSKKSDDLSPKDHEQTRRSSSCPMGDGCSCESGGDQGTGASHDSKAADVNVGPVSSPSSDDSTSWVKVDYSAPPSTSDLSEGFDRIKIHASDCEKQLSLCAKPDECSCGRSDHQLSPSNAPLIQAHQKPCQASKKGRSNPTMTFCPEGLKCVFWEKRQPCHVCLRQLMRPGNSIPRSPGPEAYQRSTKTLCPRPEGCEFENGKRCDGCHREPMSTPKHIKAPSSTGPSAPSPSPASNDTQPATSPTTSTLISDQASVTSAQAMNIDKRLLKEQYAKARQIVEKKRNDYRRDLDKSEETKEFLKEYDKYMVRLHEEYRVMREAERKCMSVTQEIIALTRPFRL